MPPHPIPTPFGPVSGLWQCPEGAAFGCILGHGAGTDMTHPSMQMLADALANAGVATLRYRFRFREYGGGPDRPDKGMAVTDAAFAYATGQWPHLRWLAAGHSFGARMSALAANAGMLPGIHGLVLFGFPLHAAGKPGTERAPILTALSLPALLLSGDRDTLAQPDLLVAALEGKKNLRLEWLPGADHGYKVPKKSGTDVPSAISAAVQQWLKDQY